MIKICFIGAGSTVFAKNVLGDCMLTESLHDAHLALYDIDSKRLEESRMMLETINKSINVAQAKITSHCGVENRKAALKNAHFVITAVQVGGYEPCTVTDFEIPKKYGLRQTIGDTLGIAGIMRGLRTLPVFESIAREMEKVAPNALLLNYVNPMSIITGYMQRHTGVNTIGLCHSVQVCVPRLLKSLDMEISLEDVKSLIAGINHMAWLLKITDKNGTDLYPEIKKRAAEKNCGQKHDDMVRYEYIRRFGYYCTESSEHNAEYNPYFIKNKYPELIKQFNIPLDEYPRRCISQINTWEKRRQEILQEKILTHERSREYAAHIMNSLVTGIQYEIGGNVINKGLIPNLSAEACIEVPCLISSSGIYPCRVGEIPLQLAALNTTNILPQLLTIEAHVTKKKDYIYQAAMLDPHTSAELSIDDIVAMCDDLLVAHGSWLPEYH